MSKPTVILVPGAWHIPAHYAPITSYLESKGYPTICKQNLSCGATDPKLDSNDDATAIRESIDSVNGDVIIAVHSYGGIPGAVAAVGAKNVIGLIFIAAFVLPAGATLNDAPDHDKSWAKVDFEKGTMLNVEPQSSMYHDADDTAVQQAIKHLLPQNLASFGSGTKETSWPNLPKIYAICTDDRIIPPQIQEGMVEQAGNWLEVKRLDTSHSPWMSKGKEDGFNVWLVSAVETLVENKLKSDGH